MNYYIGIVCCVITYSLCAELKLGLEAITKEMVAQWYPQMQTTCRVGLITNQTGKDQRGRRNIEILKNKGFNIVALLAPEHGFDCTVSAGKAVKKSVDSVTKIPVMSLYQGSAHNKEIHPSLLSTIDLLIFDIQDAGMRHYTYISTLFYSLRSAAEHNKPIIVLDRPNPLGGNVEGPLVELALESFISIAAIPLRHGMTIGELAVYFNTHILKKSAPLNIVTMHDYVRDTPHAYKIPLPLSPNIRSKSSCLGYSFLGIIGEIEPFDVGVNSPYAFQCIALPQRSGLSHKQWQQLQKELISFGVKSTVHTYTPVRKKESYRGLRFQISNIQAISSFKILVHILRFCKTAGILFNFSSCFDKALGTHAIQELLDGTTDYNQMCTKINQELKQFLHNATTAYLYKPLPQPLLLP